VLGLGVLVAASGVAAIPAVGKSPAGTGPTQSGWIVVRDGSEASETGTPGADDAGSTPAGAISWTWQSAGVVRVTFEELGFDGVPVASALAKDGRRCVVLGWAGTPVNVTVACDTLGGIRTDTPFTLTYTNGDAADGGATGAYAHFLVSTPGASSTPSSTYSHASNGGTATVTYLGTGRYRATLPGLGNAAASGTFLVTRYGASGSCKVVSWRSTPADMEVDVACRDAAGALIDASHNVLFLRKLGPEGYGGGPAAYLWADRLKQAAPYQPVTARSWQSNGKRPTIDRTAVGLYTITFPGMPKGGTAVVSAYGSGSISCQIGSVRTSAAPARVQVRCYKPDGSLADSRFTLAWTK
jgi:hypothetical protein